MKDPMWQDYILHDSNNTHYYEKEKTVNKNISSCQGWENENNMAVPQKLKTELPHDPTIPVLSIHPK